MKELGIIQSKLKAPKSQLNKFGNYNYRSCEDILEAVKPLLAENDCTLTISDDIVLIGNRIYVKAIAIITNSSGEKEQSTAFAREEETKKGMDSSQITGSTSSYARKYALNGLFCIDDTKDADYNDKDNGNDKKQSAPEKQPAPQTTKQSRTKKILFTPDKITDKLLQRLHDVEVEKKQKGERFSIFTFLESIYDITPDGIKLICNELGKYEQTHNLPKP